MAGSGLGLTGLNGLAEYQQQINADSQASPEDRNGNPADPRHGIVGEQAKPYPWQSKATQAADMHGPYGPENQLLGDVYWQWNPAGDLSQDPMADHTPSRRAAPWPKGIASGPIPGATPDDIADQLNQSAYIHGVDMGASRRMQQNYEALNDDWEEIWQVDPNSSDQVPIPKQMMSSGFMWGTRDRVQSMARQNQFGYDSRHMHRRYATGGIPGNSYWLRPGGRPLKKSLPGPARPAIGKDSPFYGQDLGFNFDPNGAILQTIPPEYVPPPQPGLAASVGTGYVPPAEPQWW